MEGGNLLKALVTDILAGGNRLFHCGDLKVRANVLSYSELDLESLAKRITKFPRLEEKEERVMLNSFQHLYPNDLAISPLQGKRGQGRGFN